MFSRGGQHIPECVSEIVAGACQYYIP